MQPFGEHLPMTLFVILPGITIKWLHVLTSPFTAKHMVIRCLSWSVVLIGTIFYPDRSTIISLGISAKIGVSSMFAILLRGKLTLLLTNVYRVWIFCNTFFAIVCLVVVRRLIENLVRLMNLNNHPRIARNSLKLCSQQALEPKRLSAYTTRDYVFFALINNYFQYLPIVSFFFWDAEDWSTIFVVFFLHLLTMLSSTENFLPVSLLFNNTKFQFMIVAFSLLCHDYYTLFYFVFTKLCVFILNCVQVRTRVLWCLQKINRSRPWIP